MVPQYVFKIKKKTVLEKFNLIPHYTDNNIVSV